MATDTTGCGRVWVEQMLELAEIPGTLSSGACLSVAELVAAGLRDGELRGPQQFHGHNQSWAAAVSGMNSLLPLGTPGGSLRVELVQGFLPKYFTYWP